MAMRGARLAVWLLLTAQLFGGIYTRGLYGKLEYVLTDDTIEYEDSKTERNSFVQIYEIGHEGSVYSPYLLVYDLSVALLLDTTDTSYRGEFSEYDSSKDVETTNYKAYLKFIQRSKYPFTIYAERRDNPIWTTYDDEATLVTTKTDKMGIKGRVKSEAATISYEISDYEIDRTESFARQNDKKRRYAVAISKRFAEHNVTASISASHEDRDYYRDDWGAGYTNSWSDTYDRLAGSLTWKIDANQTLAASTNILKNSRLDFEDRLASITYTNIRSSRWTYALSLTDDNLQTDEGTNNYLTFAASSTYKIRDNWTTTQNFTLYDASGDVVDLTMTTLDLGTRYTQRHSDTFTTNYTASLTLTSERYGDDANLTLDDRSLVAYNLGASFSKNYPDSRSSLSGGARYYQLLSTTDDSSKRLTLYGAYNKRFSKQLSYRLKASYGYDESSYTDIGSGETITRSIDTVDIDSVLNYWRPFAASGKFSSTVGVRYRSGISYEGLYPYAAMKLRYMLRRMLLLKAMGRVSSDPIYDTTTYTGNVELVYTIRRIRVILGSYYSRQTGGEPGTREHTNVYLRFVRKL